MKYRTATMPALSSQEHKPKPELRKYQSMSTTNTKELVQHVAALREEVYATPFIAVPGMGSGIRSMQRLVSVATRANLMSLDPSAQDVQELIDAEHEEYATARLVLAVFVATLSAFQVGYNTGVINVPEEVIRQTLIPGQYVSDGDWSIVVSIFCAGGLLGSSFGGTLADRWGRKQFLLVNNVCFIAGGLLEMFASTVWMLFAARLLIGCGSGAVTVVVPLYLGEISPASLRGTVGTLYQFVLVIGILMAVLLGRPLGTGELWRWLLVITVFPALLQFALMPLFIESPRWLVTRRLQEEAAATLLLLRGPECDIEFHMQVLEDSTSRPFDEGILEKQPGMFTVLCDKNLAYPLAIGLGLQLAQQFSGINAVFYYSTSFFEQANVRDPWTGSVLATAVNVVATGVAVNLMDRAGRRRLLLISSAGMFLSTVVLSVGLVLQAEATGLAAELVGYCSVVSILVFVTFFELGLGPIPWLITAEIIPSNASAMGMTAAATLNWISNFIVGFTFPHIQKALGTYTFLPFGVCCLLCFVLTLAYVPETKGKSLQEIQEFFTGQAPKPRASGSGLGRGWSKNSLESANPF